VKRLLMLCTTVAPTGFRWRLHARDSQRQGGVCEPSRNAVKGHAAGLCRHLKYRRYDRPLFRDGRSCGLGACMVCLRSAGWLLYRGDSWPKSRLLRSAPVIRKGRPGNLDRAGLSNRLIRPDGLSNFTRTRERPLSGLRGRLHSAADWLVF
jgi:hypothetical protein